MVIDFLAIDVCSSFFFFLDPLSWLVQVLPLKNFLRYVLQSARDELHSSELNLKRFSLWGNVFPIFFFLYIIHPILSILIHRME